jgi:hypothetical protein
MQRIIGFAFAAVLLSATSALGVDSLPTGSSPNEGKTPGVQPADKNDATESTSSAGTTAGPTAGKTMDSNPAPSGKSEGVPVPPKSEAN